jgi:hypothetical protein
MSQSLPSSKEKGIDLKVSNSLPNLHPVPGSLSLDRGYETILEETWQT